MTLAWLVAYEPRPWLHAHLMLAAPAPLDCRSAQERWLCIADTRDTDRALVEQYDPSRSALAYVSKMYGTHLDEIRLEGPLAAFLEISPLSRTLSRDRRRARHIEEQKKVQRTSDLDFCSF